jgi:D-beta-D-heptose 7-phosphate kinase/D-beta-D-heptose 1-phosphate adenosyltransferase
MTRPLLDILRQVARTRLVCVGDVMLDRFISGEVERISPEAPVPVLRIAAEETVLGGAGNVARNLAAIGADADLVALIGDDPAGAEIRRLLVASGIGDGLVSVQRATTTEKIRFLAGSQQLMRADRERTVAADASGRRALVAAALSKLPGASALLLSDYAKGALADDVVTAVIEGAARQQIPVVVDPKGRAYARYRGATVVTPNRRELGDAVGRPIAPGEEVAAAQELISGCGIGAVLVTLGRDGMLLVSAAGQVRLEADSRDVFDVVGAGDTVAAVLAAALGAGAHLPAASELANIAAGIVVGKVGTAVATAAEIAAALRRRDLARDEQKVVNLAELEDDIRRWRRQRLAIGFTNGCFDLIHPGHISLLRQARAACDRLIVGLNSDASVRRLKGADRPVQSEAARALVLASLAKVDRVVVFEDDTPQRLIEAIRPDVLIKGADYRMDQVVGAELVQSYGGRVVLASLEPGYSTSATIANLTK